ncbi:hypothetical protein LEP1GSC171_2932 [Leptospira santarosai str. HAI1380]|uniref:Uncharacterized protein n=1 Tax=Leptospira santarosai serovar Arenal str. MAVJ 401 TaxID=1049976 RepID=M6JLR7_9LEPT|nr:hypothetical protein LEP1GSC063_3196 [Leptospira santarosai serovar Arenal str. MAVJ 401]EMP02038.1 hypothetical protein LEP1GSC171_2932 [Leptospira santarosai str. HAI1380]
MNIQKIKNFRTCPETRRLSIKARHNVKIAEVLGRTLHILFFSLRSFCRFSCFVGMLAS